MYTPRGVPIDSVGEVRLFESCKTMKTMPGVCSVWIKLFVILAEVKDSLVRLSACIENNPQNISAHITITHKRSQESFLLSVHLEGGWQFLHQSSTSMQLHVLILQLAWQ